MKITVSLLAITVVSALTAAEAAATDFPASGACRSDQSSLINLSALVVQGYTTAYSPKITCPLKPVSVAANTTLSVFVDGIDTNPSTADDSNLRCSLNLILGGGITWAYQGTVQAMSNNATWGSFTISVTPTSAFTGYAIVLCDLGKSTASGTNMVSWLRSDF